MSSDIEDEQRAQERSEMDEPRRIQLTTLQEPPICSMDPVRLTASPSAYNLPLQLNDEPTRRKFLIERDEPSCVKLRMLMAPPVRIMLRVEMLEPSAIHERTEQLPPDLKCEPIESVVEISASFMTDRRKQLPTAVKPTAEMALPTREKALNDIVLPRLRKSTTESDEPARA